MLVSEMNGIRPVDAGRQDCHDLHSWGPGVRQCYIIPVSYTHLDVYKRQIDHRIRVIHQRNLGVSAARNQGLNYAQGTYIMFCDADDWVREDWIINLVCGIKKFPGSWVICGIEYIENGIPMRIEPFGCKDDVIQKGIHDYYLI